MKEVCIISQRYPCDATPAYHVFVQKLAWAMADAGVKVTIVSPVSYGKLHKNTKEFYEEKTVKGNTLQIIRPRYLYLGQRNIGVTNTSRLSLRFFYKACKKAIEAYRIKPDAFYGHFICLAGICACRLGRDYHKPAFFAYGESSDWSIRNYGIERVRRELATVAGAVAVSTRNKDMLLENKIVPEDKVRVFVNGINQDKFYPRDRKKSREKFNIPKDAFVLSYVGQMIERKGLPQLCTALKEIEKEGIAVKAIFAGKGDLKPEGAFVHYCGLLKPEDVPEFLSASDLFVLPTQNEGCSNAILEAMGCGLAIISSDLPFNYDILDKDNAILIDPKKPEEIKAAILKLREDRELCRKLGENSLARVKNLTMEKRAARILEFMEQQAEAGRGV